MPGNPDSITRYGAGEVSPDPFVRGYEYLQAVRQLALDPKMVEVPDNPRLITWVGNHIDAINAQLHGSLEACHGCFHAEVRRQVRILATPLAPEFGIDGCCNIWRNPVAILIDVGRTAPADWLRVVVHEYAHAHLCSPGHDRRFFEVICHLCLGLGLEPPQRQSEMETYLRYWPQVSCRINPLAFWMGYS
ncbi:MAG: hypothetical protein GDA56_24340 [Hormoscilla sp. GM7CHS1pb]|nr:hypothetical protein [Hormoscilla sp. GM7CHS1pb]